MVMMASCDCSSLLTVRSPTATSLSLKRHSFLFFVPCKKVTVLPSCSTGSADSSSSPSQSTRSYTRRLYNPLTRKILDPPPEIERHWIEADHQELASTERFTVVSYNILADRNAYEHRDLYSNVPSPYLKWNHRKRVICKELLGLDPDIICLQGEQFFRRWTSIWKSRTLWLKQDMWDLIRDVLETQLMVVQCFGKLTSSSYWKEIVLNLRVLVSEIMLLSFRFLRQMCKSDSRRLLVSNTHVLYNPSRGEVKLGQIRSLLSRAQTLSEKWGNVPVVLAGDFNSTPQSGIYKFLSSSELNIMLYDRRELSGQKNCHPAQVLGYKEEAVNQFILLDRLSKNWTDEEIITATGNSGRHLVVHPFKLNSSYATVKGSASTRGFNGEPLATSFHSKFLGTVDYLWYSDSIIPTKVLDTVPINILRRTGGLPSKIVGSDHMALVSEFAFSLATNATTELDAASSSSSSPAVEN